MYDSTAQLLAIKTIGTVESNINYVSVNYSDPITIGFMQWFGTRAAALLFRFQTENTTAWTGVPASLTNDMSAHPATDSFWNTRYLTGDEGTALTPILNANKAIQNDQATTDVAAYLTVAQSAGMDENANTQGVIFFFVMYNQRPVSALSVVRDAGPQSDINRLYATCLNEPILGQYRNRYTTALNIILSGDTSGIDTTPTTLPPAPVTSGDTGGSGVTRTAGNVNHIRLQGDALVIQFNDGHALTCNPSGSSLWLPGQDSTVGSSVPSAPGNPSPTTPPSAGATAVQSALVAFLAARIGRYAYSQGPSRLSPETNMYTDCSGLMYFTFQSVAGVNVGTWTGDQKNHGTLIAQGSSTVDVSLLEPGDLVFYAWSYANPNYDHVEMYIGSGNTYSHGGPGNGPTQKVLAGRIAAAHDYMVRRYV